VRNKIAYVGLTVCLRVRSTRRIADIYPYGRAGQRVKGADGESFIATISGRIAFSLV